MESKFKVGDRVRFTRKDCHWIETSIHNGDEGVVIGNGSGYFPNSVDVSFDGVSDEININDLELIESYDPKTAFLSELKGLLEKYDAQIGCNPVHDDEFEICIDFKDSMVSYPSYIQWLNAGYVSHFKKE